MTLSMERGLYVAASGMLAEQIRQDALTNDLANASTAGYKRDRVTQRSFQDVMLHNSSNGAPVGQLGMGVEIDRTVTDWTAGALRQTDQPLDLAISGDGFFAVRTDEGVRYTRNGRFSSTPTGELTTALGQPVLGRDGQPVRVKPDGSVDAAQVAVVSLADPVKAGDSLVTGRLVAGARTGDVRTGALENSGTDPTRAMVDMMASLRAFEASQRAIQTIDQTLQKATTQVGSIT